MSSYDPIKRTISGLQRRLNRPHRFSGDPYVAFGIFDGVPGEAMFPAEPYLPSQPEQTLMQPSQKHTPVTDKGRQDSVEAGVHKNLYNEFSILAIRDAR